MCPFHTVGLTWSTFKTQKLNQRVVFFCHLKVYLGINNTKFLPHGIEVDSFSHPDFENKPGNDIMLLKLKTPATLNETVRIIDLPKPWNEKISKDCLVMGWGSSYFSNYSQSEDLKELNMALGDLTNCQPDILCREGNIGPAQGDSGGPLVCGDIAQGVVSFYLWKTKDYVTGYTRTSQHLLWINKIMRATHQIQRGIHIKGKAYYRVGRDDGYRGMHHKMEEARSHKEHITAYQASIEDRIRIFCGETAA
ncbi:Trypsin [Triplophysa tibetana]|uniref:Trypsin n=1 Tax=Triplophysa tibetana TaxID=1572043 RepID=A0A5A9NTA1_9TELE|nr:Trypsin [Triplophysa tibetana]